MIRCAHHDAVGLADGPQVDPAVVSACGEQAPGAFTQRQTGNGAGVSLELLCQVTQAGTCLPLLSCTITHVNQGKDSRRRHEILVVFAAAMTMTRLDSVQTTDDRRQPSAQRPQRPTATQQPDGGCQGVLNS